MASFATLARGEGSSEITREFWVTEESRRLLLVSTLVNEIADRPDGLGPLAPINAVLEILTEAQRVAPDAVRALLMDPGVGSGCAYALRRLRGGATSAAPLFLDLGVVHALALAAAARAGLAWSARLPLRDGHLMIHTYGLVRFPETADATVEASAEGGRIRFQAGGHELLVPVDESDSDHKAGGPAWFALRRIDAGTDLRLSVWLDDLDPLRDLGDPVPPARLDSVAFARWRGLIEDAWDLLCRDYPDEAEAMADGVTSIVPLKHLPGWDTRSASNGEAFGGVMVSEPPDAATMAVSLVHEYQHIKLGALLHLISLTEPDDGTLYYAPWRDDPRPLPGLIQGIYAFFGIARFWRIRLRKVAGDEREVAAFEYAYALRQTAESVRIGLSAPGLTEAGRDLLHGLRKQVEEWQAEPAETVAPRIDRLAEITADSHRIGWRLRHFRPRETEVAALAGRLERSEAPDPDSLTPAVISPHPQLRWRQRIPAAARRQAVADDVAAAKDQVAAGENALLARDADAARNAFVDVLSRLDPDERAPVSDDEARAWAGLAMSLAAEGDLPAATVLSRRPDLVRAVYADPATRRSATPVEVARWLAPALANE
ncbi:MAG: HEXXH motif domain-containing protein [Actinoplanes sp.]